MEASFTIPQKLFFRIGEVCEIIKVHPHVLRYWETEFPMLAPQKNRAGQRVYRRKDVEMVMRIRNLLYEEKFTIAGAKKKLQDEMGAARTKPEVRTMSPVMSTGKLISAPEPPADIREREIPSEPARQMQPLLPLPELPAGASPHALTPQARRAVKLIKRDLEDLLTLLKSDVSIKR